MAAPVLSQRALNRAILDRQLLLRRSPLPVADAIEHLVGMQSQAPQPPYVGLWTRLERFRPEELSQLLIDRRVVRIAVMRGTVHLVTANDCLALRPLVQPIFDRDLTTNQQYGPAIVGIEMDALVAAGRALLDEAPRTPKQLGTLLAERWPHCDPGSLAYAMRSQAPLVQVPPRGLWGASGQTTYATAESWLGRPLETDPSPDRLVLRYLAAFGPATVNDVQTWAGLPRLGEVVERVQPKLRTFGDERGRQLFDLPDAPRPDPDTPAPVRFLPQFDNLLLSHADRTRIISEEDRPRIFTINGIIPGTVLIDGFVRATWKISRQRQTATLVIEPFRPLSKKVSAAITSEGNRLLRFAAADQTHEVQVATPT
jgi:hypothetical protein